MRTKDRKPKVVPAELEVFKKEILEVLEYYADAAHYEPFNTLGAPRGPGVLKDRGGFARRTIAKHWPERLADD